jgi:NAD(P)-dependent dehydrogenase (short-subunit alcohol dehydrogenase family)
VRRLLITGSNRGLGRAIARYFRRRAYRIASLNRTLSGEGWLGEVRCDLDCKDDIATAVPPALDRLGGRVDVCVMNAAVRHLGPMTEMADECWEESLRVNLSSLFYLSRAVLPHLEASHGALVIIGSQAAAHAFEGGAAYCSTKAAAEALGEVMALETAGRVRTTVVTPWAVRNHDGDTSPHKIEPASIARLVFDVVHLPGDAVVSQVEVRPGRPAISPLRGMSRLQVL